MEALNTVAASTDQTIRIRNSSLYLPYALYQNYFSGLDAVILLLHESRLLILPVRHPGGGGLLMKVRNLQGDRVIHALEFFRDHDIDDTLDQEYPVRWDSENAALIIDFS